MRIITYPLLLMTTFLGFSKSKPEIFHGPDDIVVIIARQVSGREICVN